MCLFILAILKTESLKIIVFTRGDLEFIETKIKIPIANGIMDSFIINQFLEMPNFSPSIPIKPVRRILTKPKIDIKFVFEFLMKSFKK